MLMCAVDCVAVTGELVHLDGTEVGQTDRTLETILIRHTAMCFLYMERVELIPSRGGPAAGRTGRFVGLHVFFPLPGAAWQARSPRL